MMLFLRKLHVSFTGSNFGRLLLLASSTFITFPVLAQSPAGSNWDHLKALPVNTKLHVSADKGGHTCRLVSVDDASLVCGTHTFQRADVKSVKLTRYAVSYGGGALIGAGVGAVVGLGVSAGTDDAFFKNDKASFAGAGAAVGVVVGALVTGPFDLFKGPTVYRR
jgi:hypothetical protein